ncbi:TetR/AcrR family transcriptional regulator [Kribbella jiaozuonensis]|uniref:TetR/AcrR family transcriptional regulator n=1 Tax=Kribbella jiaozuonensis TaxID=2575441 RepID=A0A4U3LFU0_9ACTN|nr:TetR/AcrR family transcriptional regulator [Kribbella jiaozuonensis]TKK74281.1 TetR/AcrR family transcriptional regulator [Kribbella jiaozuonensis]
MRDEVKQHAWTQIAEAGVSALSLNAIGKQMGVSGPALYRYFESRDELITELIRDAYSNLADTVRSAYDGGADVVALAQVIRTWALANPQRYLLIYGTPVPDDTIMSVLVDATGGSDRAVSFLTRLHGILSLELAGYFAGTDVDLARLVESEISELVSSDRS